MMNDPRETIHTLLDLALQESDITHIPSDDFDAPAVATWYLLPPHPEEQPQAQAKRFLDDFHRARAEQSKIVANLEQSSYAQLLGMLEASAATHFETREHMLSVGTMSAMMAAACGAADQWCSRLEHAAALHDIGKIGISPSLMNSSSSELSSEDYRCIKAHTELGAKLLSASPTPLMALAEEVAFSHHERWDGNGYPHGLAGEAIPLAGRIVAIIDFIDKFLRDRPYRKALEESEVFDRLVAESGYRFDPDLVATAVSMRARFARCRKAIESIYSRDLPQLTCPWQEF